VPCIFCIAVFATIVGAIAGTVIDELETKLRGAGHDVERSADTDSVAKFDLQVSSSGRDVPVAVTVYKQYGRVRIQVLTHDITREEAEKLEDQLAEALGLKIVDRSDAHSEEKVREAAGGQAARAEAKDKQQDKEKEPDRTPEKRAEHR
jgi:septal ring factor EnvC (AmiA/AmiB activator)